MEVLNILKKSAVFILFLFFVLCIVGSVVAADNDTLTTDESNMIDKSDEASESDVSDEYDDTVTGTGCTTTIIQGYNNSSAISFRRDATNKKTVNVVSNSSIVKQYKDSSYFFHVLVSKDGWLVGNGGADNAVVNHNIESNALAMINKNTITTANMNNIYKQESKLSVGHFVIKSPDGSYSLIIKNNKRVFKNQAN